jgi:hypothetical protein
MKLLPWMMIAAAAVLLTGATVPAKKETTDITPSTREFMRAKLAVSQKILEGLATEDFDLITKNAEKLSELSKEPAWEVLANPDYQKYSVEFRRNVSAMAAAGKSRNLDGATLAYLKVTMDCMECHRYIRSNMPKTASLR